MLVGPQQRNMTQERVLIVEDEENERTGLAELVSGWGYRTDTAADGVEALEKIPAFAPSIVITDVKMPRMGGMELVEKLSDLAQSIAVVMVTAQKATDTAFHAGRLGVQDYIEKPIDFRRLRSILTNIGEILNTRTENESLRRRLRDKGALGCLVGASAEMQEVFHLIEQVAPSTASVLITGASGTGKELVARTIHDLSPRRNKPFVPINCAAIPETLIESEIFGHEKGSFTGALERRTGCFELAEGGTLLLDEIGEMPVGTQAKLLRVLEDRKLRRLGSKVETPVDVRVVPATNKDPEEAVANGELRGDLYYRLNVFNIQMPPLRDHPMDVQAIAEKMIHDMNERHHCMVSGMRDALLKRLEDYRWPGNVRELRNTIERATILAGSGLIGVEHLPPHFGEPGFAPLSSRPRQPGRDSGIRDVEAIKAEAQRLLDDRKTVHVEVGTTVNEAEKQLILRTLDSTHNNKTKAAEILGISAKTLQNKLKEYSSAEDSTE